MAALGTIALLRVSDFPTDQIIFDVISAFGTVGPIGSGAGSAPSTGRDA
jgi:trk system potassium uptake protein TrkH